MRAARARRRYPSTPGLFATTAREHGWPVLERGSRVGRLLATRFTRARIDGLLGCEHSGRPASVLSPRVWVWTPGAAGWLGCQECTGVWLEMRAAAMTPQEAAAPAACDGCGGEGFALVETYIELRDGVVIMASLCPACRRGAVVGGAS